MRRRFKKYALLLLVLILVISLTACVEKREPAVQWYKNFDGGSGNSVQQTTDGGYIICGATESFEYDDYDAWLIKTDEEGNKLWDKTFGGKNGDMGIEVRQTIDGGFIVCGSTGSYGAGEDVWLIKTDAEGNKLWESVFGGKGIDIGYSVQQTTDGGYVVCGITVPFKATTTEALLIKTDTEGNKLWDNTFSDKWDTAAASLQQTTGGGYIICGFTMSYEAGTRKALLIKTDKEGNKLWDKTFSDKGYTTASSVQQTSDGGYIIFGEVTSVVEPITTAALLINTDAEGNKRWGKKFGYEEIFFADSVRQTTDGGYIMCGWAGSWAASESEILLIKTDVNGNKRWEKRFGGEGAAIGHSIQQTSDGGYIVCGTTKSYEGEGNKVLLLKIAPEH